MRRGSGEARHPIIAFHSLHSTAAGNSHGLVRLLFSKTLVRARHRAMQCLRQILGQNIWNRDSFGLRILANAVNPYNRTITKTDL